VKLKQKVWLACFIVMLGSIATLFLSTALHLLLSGKADSFQLSSLPLMLESLGSNRSHLLLFLCLQGIILLLAMLFFFLNSQPYQSQLRQVAPGIETPIATGQHQHGSARWLRKEEWSQSFDHYTLDLHHPYIQHLVAIGYDDLQFLKSFQQEEDQDDTLSSQDDSQT